MGTKPITIHHSPITRLASRFGVEHDIAFLFQFFNVREDAQFIDGADGRGAHLERHPFARLRDEELLRLQVRVEAAFRFAVRVRNVVARDGSLAGQITNFRHDTLLFKLDGPRGAA